MKKQCLSLIVVSALLLGLLLTGCGQPEKKTEELPAGLHLVVEGLPEIESVFRSKIRTGIRLLHQSDGRGAL